MALDALADLADAAVGGELHAGDVADVDQRIGKPAVDREGDRPLVGGSAGHVAQDGRIEQVVRHQEHEAVAHQRLGRQHRQAVAGRPVRVAHAGHRNAPPRRELLDEGLQALALIAGDDHELGGAGGDRIVDHPLDQRGAGHRGQRLQLGDLPQAHALARGDDDAFQACRRLRARRAVGL